MNMSDVMKLKNVDLSARMTTMLAGTTVPEYTSRGGLLADVIWRLATETPSWRFVASGGNLLSDDRLRIELFDVFQDGERLGSIAMQYYRRDYHIAISSRIAKAQLDRGDTVYTKSATTAVTRAKKLLVKRNMNDILEEAWSATRSLVNNAEGKIGNAMRNAYDGALHSQVRKFVFGQNLEDFKAFLHTLTPPKNTEVLGKLETYMQLNEDANVVTSVVGHYRGGNSCLVIVEDGKYIVQSNEASAESYDDETLPEHLRGKLGLLKLANEAQMVANVGCRVTNKVFLILL